MKTSLKAILVVIIFVFANLSLAVAGVPESGNEVVASFSGTANVSGLAMDITLDAKRLKNGLVYGTASVVDNFDGKITELVSSFGANDFWCIKAVVSHPIVALGQNAFFFIKDIVAGPDLVAFFFYNDDTTCDNFALGNPYAYEAVTTGDFVSQIVPDPILTQCQTDLVDCTAALGECSAELPVLPANYSAKLTGKGGDIKIAATRKKNTSDDFSGKISGIGIGNKFEAKVANLVAPSDGKPNWCAEGTIISADVPSLVTQKVVVYVRDISKKYDLMSYQIGVGLSCATASPGTLDLIVGGDFTGGKISTL